MLWLHQGAATLFEAGTADEACTDTIFTSFSSFSHTAFATVELTLNVSIRTVWLRLKLEQCLSALLGQSFRTSDSFRMSGRRRGGIWILRLTVSRYVLACL